MWGGGVYFYLAYIRACDSVIYAQPVHMRLHTDLPKYIYTNICCIYIGLLYYYFYAAVVVPFAVLYSLPFVLQQLHAELSERPLLLVFFFLGGGFCFSFFFWFLVFLLNSAFKFSWPKGCCVLWLLWSFSLSACGRVW